MNLEKLFNTFASATSRACGRPITFVLCLAVVIAWGVSGPAFGFSETWQLVINTGTTIITFLMVFLIQNTQNRDNAAIQAKLDELILTSKADNEYIGIEKLTDKELLALQKTCQAEASRHQQVSEAASKEVAARREQRRRDSPPKKRPATQVRARKPA